MVLLGCSGLKSYEKATAQFGEATNAGVSATRGVIGSAHDTCQMRAWFSGIFDRFGRPGGQRGLDVLERSSDQKNADGTAVTWREYCQGMSDRDQVFAASLTALETYATALRNVATDDAVALDTDLTAALASDVDAFGQQIGTSAFGEVQALGAPLSALANVVLDLIRTAKLREAILKGEGPVNSILEGVGAYLQAARDQDRDARALLGDIERSADQVIPVWDGHTKVPTELPGQVLALFEFARLEEARLTARDAELDAAGAIVGDLRTAHEKLVAGAHATLKDEDVRKYIAGTAQAVAKQVNILRSIRR